MAWAKISSGCIIQGFKNCCISNNINGSGQIYPGKLYQMTPKDAPVVKNKKAMCPKVM